MLDRVEGLPDVDQIDPKEDDHYNMTALAHFGAVCQRVTGHAKMTILLDAFNAVREMDNFASLESIEEFPKYWKEVGMIDIRSTANSVWALVESLRTQSDKQRLQLLLAKLDSINGTHAMLEELYATKTSKVPKTPGFTLVSTEAWHVTISNQAKSLKRIVEKTFFVAGASRIDRARNVVLFFTIDSGDVCAALQRMPHVCAKICGDEVGEQMIGLILATQAALTSGPYQNVTKALVTDRLLLTQCSFPKILKQLKECQEHTPLMSTQARTRAGMLMECEKDLAAQYDVRFQNSSYDLLEDRVQQMTSVCDSVVLEAARRKVHMIHTLHTTTDYVLVRDLVPHVAMMIDSTLVEHAKAALAAVREMISCKHVPRLRCLLDLLALPPVLTGIPDLHRINELLVTEATLDELHADSDIRAALCKIGRRFNATPTMARAEVRVSRIQKLCESNYVYDLYSAAGLGDVLLIKHYLDAGASVHDGDKNGVTPLMHASAKNRIEAIQYLLAAGARVADTAHNGYNALHFAAEGGLLMAVQVLVPLMK